MSKKTETVLGLIAGLFITIVLVCLVIIINPYELYIMKKLKISIFENIMKDIKPLSSTNIGSR